MDSETATRKSLYSTPCKHCCFAQYKGTTQVGCAFDRIDKFRRNGVEVLEVYDDDREYFVIGTVCTANRHRESPFAMRHPGRERKAAARKELELEVEVVLVMNDDHTVEQVKTTVDSLLAQTLLPAKVTVAVNRDGIQPKEIRAVLPGDWIAQFIMARNPDKSRIPAGRCIDYALVGSKAHFYAVFSPGFVVPADFIRSIDVAVNDELERFVLLEPNQQGEGMVVQMRAHHYYGGNSEAEIQGEDAGEDAGKRVDSIAEKIRYRVKAEDLPQYIRKVTELCPGLA